MNAVAEARRIVEHHRIDLNVTAAVAHVDELAQAENARLGGDEASLRALFARRIEGMMTGLPWETRAKIYAAANLIRPVAISLPDPALERHDALMDRAYDDWGAAGPPPQF